MTQPRKIGQFENMAVLLGFLFLCAIVAALGGVTATGPDSWYASLEKPVFQPPNSIFGPVWTVLYALMALSAWVVWKAAPKGRRAGLIGLFLLQLALNAAWTPLFFGAHMILASLFDIVLLLIVLGATIAAFWRLAPIAGLLLVPYFAWILFATALTVAIWRLNPGV